MSEQEYYYNGQYVTIYGQLQDEEDMVVVKNDNGELVVCKRSNLVTKESSYQYRRAHERADEIEAITKAAEKNFDKLVDKLVDKAIKSLALRIKMNIAFGESGSAAPYALMLSNELEKMIKETAPKIVKEEGDIF